MFEDTRPATLPDGDGPDPWAAYRVEHPRERQALLRELRDGNVPLALNAPGGVALSASLWSLDTTLSRLSLGVDPHAPQLGALLEADEVVAVAYLEAVKLQFELHGLLLVHGTHASSLQCRAPDTIYRFQRRDAFRVRVEAQQAPRARFRHPSLPEMGLALRVIDLSVGGCALWKPHDVPPLQAGTLVADAELVLDAQTRFSTPLLLQHVSASSGEGGTRLGCAWQELHPLAERQLQRWLDQAQKRRRLLSIG